MRKRVAVMRGRVCLHCGEICSCILLRINRVQMSRMLAGTTLLLLFVQTAFAAKGEVVYRKSGCDYFVVETLGGFALLEWYGGSDPDVGDNLVGDFESYGMKDIYNLSSENELRVWVEDYWMSKEDALEGLYEQCD